MHPLASTVAELCLVQCVSDDGKALIGIEGLRDQTHRAQRHLKVVAD